MKAMVAAATVALVAAGCASDSKPHRGHLSIWPEVEVFTPCGSTDPLWLDYNTKTREPIAKEHWALQKKPYGTTFAVMEGEVGPQLDCGFCQGYKGSFKVSRVLEQRIPHPNDCTS